MDLASRVKLICGIFLSISIVSTVLACASWDFQQQTPLHNALYISGLLLAFMLNSGIAYCLLIGTVQHRSSMFFPYIVCSTIYIGVSIFGAGFFLASTMYSISDKTRTDHLYLLIIFIFMLSFWYWSLRTVREYRDFVRKISGEHVIFTNPEFV